MKIGVKVSGTNYDPEDFENACLRTLERWGLAAEGFAVRNLTELKAVDTGRLRNDINHKVLPDKKQVLIGTNVEYGVYIELGTGKYAQGGRPDPWVYQDDEGRWHHTHGQRARPYLKPAITEHKQTYINIVKDEFEGE